MRPLHTIASEIRRDWKNLSPHAKPYLDAMAKLNSVKDKFIAESGDDIVLRFLCNAAPWRGETARRIKAELNSMVRA